MPVKLMTKYYPDHISSTLDRLSSELSQLRALVGSEGQDTSRHIDEVENVTSLPGVGRPVSCLGLQTTVDAEPGSAFLPLPDPKFVRDIIRARQLRSRFLDPGLLTDPAWDMLLDLLLAALEGKQVSVSSLCIASGVPATTALRWISHMTNSGLFERYDDRHDGRRVFMRLSKKGLAVMANYFHSIDQQRQRAA